MLQKQSQSQSLGCTFRTAGSLTAKLLVLLGQIRAGYPLISGFVQPRFF